MPERLDRELILVHAIDEWSRSVTVDGLPAGVWELRCVLADAFADTSDPVAGP